MNKKVNKSGIPAGRNLVIDFGDNIQVLADNNQYILRVDGKYFYYVCVEHVFQELYELKRKHFAMKGTDKTIKGFIDASLKAKEWMEEACKVKFANPYQ